MDCVSAESVVDFVDGALGPAERAAVEAHLDRCASCRRLVSELGRSGIDPRADTEVPRSTPPRSTPPTLAHGAADAPDATVVERGPPPTGEPAPRSSGPGIEPVFMCGRCHRTVEVGEPVCRLCDAPRPSSGWPADAQAGRLVGGRYRLVGPLGAGGMGEVYLARDGGEGGSHEEPGGKDLGEVVVKLVGGGEGGAIDPRRFLNEARAARALTSPHVVKLYDFGFDDDGRPYLVMELLRGVTLRQLLSIGGRLDIGLALDIAGQIAEAMQEVHDAGIVHRDLKPENLMLVGAEQRFVKVLDFGAARLGGADATRSFIGTPRYMSPEQIYQEDLDGRTDVYALGAVLFEMIAGTPAIQATAIGSCIEAHMKDQIPRLGSLVRDVPAEVEAFVRCLMARDRHDRPDSMREVRARLAELARREPARGTRPQRRRGRGLLVAAGLAVVVLAASAGLRVMLDGRSAVPAGPAALEPAAEPSGAPATGPAALAERPQPETSAPAPGATDAAALADATTAAQELAAPPVVVPAPVAAEPAAGRARPRPPARRPPRATPAGAPASTPAKAPALSWPKVDSLQPAGPGSP